MQYWATANIDDKQQGRFRLVRARAAVAAGARAAPPAAGEFDARAPVPPLAPAIATDPPSPNGAMGPKGIHARAASLKRALHEAAAERADAAATREGLGGAGEGCPPLRAIRFWSWAVVSVLDWLEANLPGRFFVLRIEDLVLAPSGAARAARLRALEAFLGVPPATNRTIERLGAEFDGYADSYNARNGFRQFAPGEQARIVDAGRAALERLGYGEFLALDRPANATPPSAVTKRKRRKPPPAKSPFVW